MLPEGRFGMAMRLAPFRLERRTYVRDDVKDALGIFNNFTKGGGSERLMAFITLFTIYQPQSQFQFYSHLHTHAYTHRCTGSRHRHNLYERIFSFHLLFAYTLWQTKHFVYSFLIPFEKFIL